jgi:leucine-rich repeat protein SHOC2
VNLNVLDVRSNKLTLESLPAELGRLVNLKKLFFSNNLLVALPPEIGNMQGLKVIPSLSPVPLLPYQYTYSQQELEVANNGLTSLPSELGNLIALEKINLSGIQYLSLLYRSPRSQIRFLLLFPFIF